VKMPSSTAVPSCTVPNRFRSALQYFQDFKALVGQLPYHAIDEIVEQLMRCYERRRTTFLFGNGGSAALASHFATDLSKGTLINRDSERRFRVVSLTDNIPLITAWANDSSYEDVFAEQLRNLISPGDVAFAISGSGNSPNVLAALRLAKMGGAITVGLTGYQGGRMKPLCDHCVVVPSDNMQIIEDFHLSVAHAVFSVIRSRISERAQAQSFAKTMSTD
jgi:D-sedoheptulose 7-phosphate isomerase